VACRTGNEVPPGDSFITVSDVVQGQGPGLWGSFAHQRCFHCGDAACVTVCPTGALSKWNGLTVIDQEKCSGCGYCTDACPFKVPHVLRNRVSKCTACFDLVKDGQEPWCVRTCPTQAIGFGEHEKLLAEAKARVVALRQRYPNAEVYGETPLGGLGLLMILLDQPAAYGLPTKPVLPATVTVWQGAVQPAATGLSALAAVTMGLMFIVARRRHTREQAEMRESAKPVLTPQAQETPASGQEHE